jgi:uncharacterized protein (TIGR02117 family)
MQARLGLVQVLLRTLPWIALAACAGLEPARRPLEPPPGAPIYVVSNGWHSGVVVEASGLAPDRWPQRVVLGSHRYLEVGWGDRDAYLAERITPGLALRAALVSRGSVLLVAGFDEPVPQRYRGIDVVELRVSAHALDALAGFIEASLAEDSEGRPIRLGAGGVVPGVFFLARGRFHALNTCNSWTAAALRAAGLPLAPRLTLTAYQLMQQVVPLGRLVPVPPG